MKILSVETEPAAIGFETYIEFEMWYTEDWYNNESITNELKELCYWLGNTFVKNYVVLEYGSRLVAGGMTNNKKDWNYNLKNTDKEYIRTGKYQLRCSTADATIFLLKYQQKEE